MPGTALKVPQKPASSLWLAAAIAAGLVLITLATFYGLHRCEFVNLDDFDYVVNNPHVNKGLSWPVFTWAFTRAYSCNWHPLTWLSHALDCELFGLNPAGHHVTNLLLHALSTVVLFIALRRMTGAVWRSAFVAALFAVHPQHVESVAWISERKDVLSGLFFMLTLYAYARYAEFEATGKLGHAPPASPATDQTQKAKQFRRTWYAAALVSFALGLLSKPMLVTLPFLLLLLDYWPLGRLRIDKVVPSTKRLIREKLPFFGLATVSSVITILAQRASQVTLDSVPITDRWGNGTLSYISYLRQMLWPEGLAAYYPYPKPVSTGDAALAGLLLLVITLAVLAVRRSRPFALTGWLWFLGMLVPVIGIVQVGAQGRADRYTYLPSIGVFLAVTWAAATLFSDRQRYKLAAAACGSVVCLSVLAHLQAQYWTNSILLFRHASDVVPNNYFALTQIAMTELKSGGVDSAFTNLTRALELEPSYPVANHQMGVALFKQGKGAQAIPFLHRAEAQPELRASTHLVLALVYLEASDLKEARSNIEQAEIEKPGEPDIAVVRANLFIREGKLGEAEKTYKQLLAAHPNHPQAQVEFANFLLNQNRPSEAEPLFLVAVKREPKDVSLRTGLASAFALQGKIGPALQEMEEARNLAPADPMVHFQSGQILGQALKTREALACYEKTLELNPAFAGAMNNIAWILATDPDDQVRNGKRAVELAEKACELTKWEMPMLIGTLAAAYAEAGRFKDAIKAAERARDKARASHEEEIAKRNEELLELYRSGKAYRERKGKG